MNGFRRRTLKCLFSAYPIYSLGFRPVVARSIEKTFDSEILSKSVPSDGHRLPIIGLGSWITFNIGDDPIGLRNSEQVIAAFLDAGGRLIDSSPMYGSSQATIGKALQELKKEQAVFAADKLWVDGLESGVHQLRASEQRWGLDEFQLVQIHNLLDWETHLPRLQEIKANGQLQYIGITTSHGRRHAQVEKILQQEEIDFLQITYNLADRKVEDRILPLAQERGVAVIANRPFGGGRLIRRLKKYPFPKWATEAGLKHWPDFALKYIVSHPALTCAIPATSRVEHLLENMQACKGELLDPALRIKMQRRVADI